MLPRSRALKYPKTVEVDLRRPFAALASLVAVAEAAVARALVRSKKARTCLGSVMAGACNRSTVQPFAHSTRRGSWMGPNMPESRKGWSSAEERHSACSTDASTTVS